MNTRLNTIPVEDFLNKARLAIKSNQKQMVLSIKEVTDLQNSLSIIMTRLAGDLDSSLTAVRDSSVTEVKVNGGKF